MPEHTKTPWAIDPKADMHIVAAGRGVASTGGPGNNHEEDGGYGENRANAQHIVRCVNSHDALVEALETLRNRYVSLIESGDCGHWEPRTDEETDLHLQNAVTAVLAVRQILDGGAGPLGPKPTARRLLDEGRY